MADTTVASDNNVEQWSDDEYYAYTRTNPFKFLMGTGSDKPIQVKEELGTKPGDAVTFSLVANLSGDGVEDDDTLENNEEQLLNYGCRVVIHQLRNAVVVGQHEAIKVAFDLWKAAQKMLRSWEQEKLRDLIIARMLSPVTDGITTYSAATEAQKDAWAAAQNPAVTNQRVLYGAAKGNSSGDHSADLTQIDGTADDLHPDIVRLVKRLAQSCAPRIRPCMIEGGDAGVGGERYYLLAGSLPFRDLQANMDTIHQNADVRGDANQIFSGGMIKVGNVIVVEVPEMDRALASGGCMLENVGDSGTVEVEPTFLLGAQAVLLAWGQRTRIIFDERDYKNKRGVAVAETRGAKKAVFNSFDHGMARAYVSAVGD